MRSEAAFQIFHTTEADGYSAFRVKRRYEDSDKWLTFAEHFQSYELAKKWVLGIEPGLKQTPTFGLFVKSEADSFVEALKAI